MGILSLNSQYKYKLKAYKVREAEVLEVHDLLFHHDSAVMMPGAAEPDDPDKISGIIILAVALQHAEDNPEKAIVVVGHTDTSGSDDYNVKLSWQRAENVYFLLMGKKDDWVTSCDKKDKVEDRQHILKWLTTDQGYDCDPGTIDNKDGPATQGALKKFQQQYNQKFGKSIKEDGKIGKETWGAFYDTYQDALAKMLKTDAAGVDKLRGNLKFVESGKEFVGCGENFPREAVGVDNLRSQTNRRVEILFFKKEPVLPLDCHPGKGKCVPDKCVIYKSGTVRIIPIPPELRPPALIKILREETVASDAGGTTSEESFVAKGAAPAPKPAPKPDVDVKVDDHFAPKRQNLNIVYQIRSLAKEKVHLEITSPHYDSNPIFKIELTEAQKKDGKHTISWDGKTNASGGVLKDRYITPLFSPYSAVIKAESGVSDKMEFKVLYAAIVIRTAPWTPDEKEPPESDEKAWVQYKLNELGYYGGPVGKDFDDYLKKAVIRYKVNHKDLHKIKYKDYDDKITAELKAALKKNDNKREFMKDDAFPDPSKESVIRVEAINYEDGEFGKPSKGKKELERLNRPLIPIEVVVFLKSRGGSPVFVPEATGDVRINWSFKDSDEDLSSQFTTAPKRPSQTREYLQKALAVKGGRSGNGDNCPDSLGGIRTASASDWKSPFVVGEFFDGTKAEEDKAQGTVFTKACVDKDKFPKRLGKAGIYFRPSFVAGDDYQLRAEIDFTGLPNKDDLEKFHGITSTGTRPHVGTGIIRIRRFSKVAVVVDWPKRKKPFASHGNDQWAEIAEEFGKAHMDFDVKNIVQKKITDLLTLAEYQDIVTKKTKHKDKAKISLLEDSLVGVDLPAQKKKKAATYRAALRTFTVDNYWLKIRDSLHAKLREKIRKDHPTGFILMNFMTHRPVNVQKAPPKDKSIANADYITWGVSFGLSDSIIVADQMDPDFVYYVVAHEFGHSFWLLHWEKTGESNFNDHDNNDHNCVMSYSSSKPAHMKPGEYSPHFCGKCNLKLRGWDIDKKGLPKKS